MGRLSAVEDLEFFDLVLEGSFSTSGTEPPVVGKKGKGKGGTGGSKGGKKGVEGGKGGKRGRRLSAVEDLEFFDLVLEGSFSTTGTMPPEIGKKGKGKGGSEGGKKGTDGSKGGKKGVDGGKGGKRGRRLSEVVEDLEFFDLVLEGSFSTTGTEPPVVGKKGKGKGGSEGGKKGTDGSKGGKKGADGGKGGKRGRRLSEVVEDLE